MCGTVTEYSLCERHARVRGRRERDSARKSLHRARLMKKTGSTCENCGWYDPTGRTLEVDHRVPLYRGGADDYANKQLLCSDCHRDKTVAEQQKGDHLTGG